MKLSTEMRCAMCGLVSRTFERPDEDDDDYCCTDCGWLQSSTEAGCAEMCLLASWHGREAYETYAAIAREGGYDVPDSPPKSAVPPPTKEQP